MTERWSGLRRWIIGNRRRALDVALLVPACVLPGVWLAVAESAWLGAIHPALAGRGAGRLALWLALVLVALLLFVWRRWREIDLLLEEADTDSLTGLPNRRKIELLLQQEIDRALRYARPLSIVMIDIDHFKQVNDSHGHATGDVVLMAVARRVQRRMRISDHFGRWGGEEFLMICPETDTADAMLVADRIRRTIKQKPMRAAGTVTASFGVSTYSGHGDYGKLVDEADTYLYIAKEQGRDRVISKFVVMAQDAMRREGREVAPPVDTGEGLYQTSLQKLSTLLTTVAQPLERVRRRVGRR